jgi:3-hydroxyisobutyrate dehydrogenase
MGSAMARDAVRKGISVVGWDRAPTAVGAAGDGIHATSTPVDAVKDADVVVTMVTDANAVMDVMETHGAFAAMRSGSSWVQMSTIGVEGTERALRLAATRADVTFIDAPVSGSKAVVEQGKLLVLASGDRERAGAPVQQFFDAIGTAQWLGAAGQGTRMKLLFNAWIAVMMEGVAEIGVLADALGIDLARFATLATGGPLVPPWALAKMKKIADQATAAPEFPFRWAEKDVGLALAAAHAERAQLPVLGSIGALWASALERFGAQDLSAVYVALREGVMRSEEARV